MTDIPMRQRVEEYISKLQDDIVAAFEKLDPNAPAFKRDSWTRPQGGAGRSCVFAVPFPPEGAPAPQTVLEKGGVNVSVVHGMLPPPAIKQMRADHSSIPDITTAVPFFAAGSCSRCALNNRPYELRQMRVQQMGRPGSPRRPSILGMLTL